MTHKKERSFDILSAFNAYAPSWGGMFILLGLMLLGSILGTAIATLLNLIVPMTMGEQQVLTYPLMFVPPMFYAIIRSRIAQASDFGEKKYVPLDEFRLEKGQISTWMLIFMCATGTITTAIATEPLIELIPTTGPVMGPFYNAIKAAMEMLTNGPLWIALLTTGIFAPFFEEWLCRGMVLRGLLQKTTPAVAIAVSAAFFALIHMNPWQAIPAFILGCIFGLVYYKTGSLKLTMLMHCVNNSFSILLSQAPAFQGKEYVREIFSDSLHYYVFYLAALALSALLVARLSRLK